MRRIMPILNIYMLVYFFAIHYIFSSFIVLSTAKSRLANNVSQKLNSNSGLFPKTSQARNGISPYNC